MSARFGLGLLFGALLSLKKLWLSVSPAFLNLCMPKSLLCCSVQQRNASFLPSVSMRLRPKRTCSGVECFGGYHIKRFLNTTFCIQP
ncbi:hypothetical protein DM860_008336 [Cuscuta australis]|uniref:Secreted protein n=1 Tax=Cuscuta australis TaxID=267555 RepID=A0A328D3W1_9ASTE|nr:hypothetical protein DM860_008336 [Cuscuta australis]